MKGNNAGVREPEEVNDFKNALDENGLRRRWLLGSDGVDGIDGVYGMDGVFGIEFVVFGCEVEVPR